MDNQWIKEVGTRICGIVEFINPDMYGNVRVIRYSCQPFHTESWGDDYMILVQYSDYEAFLKVNYA